MGSILVNSLHDELNTVTIYTKRPYDPTPDKNAPPIQAGGDGDFDNPPNYFNKKACLDGMQQSFTRFNKVFQGNKVPKHAEYGGLNKMPDVDESYRQPQPLFLLGKNNKIYYRSNLSKIEILSPSDLKATQTSPQILWLY